MGLTSHNWGYAMSNNDTNTTSNKQARDGFFIISMTAWENLFNGAMRDVSESEAVRTMAAYLTLCCGTGGDHKTTSWSAGAIRKYAGISQRPAERAIYRLELYGCINTIKKPEKNKLPTYKINFFDNNPKEQSSDNIFVPNGIVTGVNGEDSPLKRLVRYQDPYILYLFIRLYGFQDKYLDVIEPSIVSTTINKDNDLDAIEVYNEQGLLKIWATEEKSIESAYPTSKFYDFKSHDDDHFLDERTENSGLWGFLSILGGLGLLSNVTYACNGDRAYRADEIDFICEVGTEKQKALAGAIGELGELKHSSIGEELPYYENYVVLPSTYRKIHFQTFYQLRYRTKLGEARNRYSEENALYKTMAQSMNKIFKTYEKQPQ